MALTVTTDGPIEKLPDVIEPYNRNFSDMINAISDEIDDTTKEYFSQIQNAIFSAIRFCQSENFYFNETSDIIFYTKVGQEWYDKLDCDAIETATKIKKIYIEDDNAASTEVKRVTPYRLEELTSSNNSNGKPYLYGFYEQKLRFYPVPNDRYRMRLYLEPYRLQDITKADQDSVWFNEAFELIKARAKYELYKDIMKDPNSAAQAYSDFKEYLAKAYEITSKKISIGRIKATSF